MKLQFIADKNIPADISEQAIACTRNQEILLFNVFSSKVANNNAEQLRANLAQKLYDTLPAWYREAVSIPGIAFLVRSEHVARAKSFLIAVTPELTGPASDLAEEHLRLSLMGVPMLEERIAEIEEEMRTKYRLICEEPLRGEWVYEP